MTIKNKLLRPLALLSLTTLTLLSGCSSRPVTQPTADGEQVSMNEARQAIEMAELIKQVTYRRAGTGKPLKRFNQVKSVGCFDAEFTVYDNVPGHLAKGVFASPATYPAVLRLANATKEDDREKDLRGLSVTVKLGQQQQDFLFNSYPALFAANPEAFLDFIKAQAKDSLAGYFVHYPKALALLLKARKRHDSLFGLNYFSTTPSRLGTADDPAVKYSVRPCEAEPELTFDRDSADFLRQGMVEHLKQQPACFEFMLQSRTDEKTMPIEDASVIWPEKTAPFVAVAKITISNQDFTAPQQMARCEAMTFDPWRGLPEHQPLGGINRVRKTVYELLNDYRSRINQDLQTQ